jgi:ABC-2 type transport system ATP-binding protein
MGERPAGPEGTEEKAIPGGALPAPGARDTAERVIEVHGLTKHYAGVKAVDGIDFEVDRGEVYSLLGPNGAGKTTTVEILEGLRDPTSGEARVFGVDVRRGYASIRGRVGVLPQEFEPFDRLRPREAVRYWASLMNRSPSDGEVAAILETVGLTSRANAYAMHLSGGEKRRLGIAMALISDPDLVFLDEPTTGLDPSARRGLWDVIRGLKRAGKTVVLTTHYLDEAEQLADHVAILNQGRIVVHGTPDELITRHGGGTTIVLAGAGPAGKEALAARGIDASLDGDDVLVHVTRAADVRGTLSKLASIEMPLTEIYTRRDTLEDVFLRVVGARMAEGVLAA